MPTYRGITLSLISQFDILAIPEYAPPGTDVGSLTSLDSTLPQKPTLLIESQALVSVYSPTYASSQFWLRYSVSPPYAAPLYYFKLYLNGKLFVSWGCGEEDGYRGKTIFGLFDSGESWMGTSGVEKRVLYFARELDEELTPETADLGDMMEIRTFRSKGRKRIKKSVEKLSDTHQDRVTQDLVNEGQVRSILPSNPTTTKTRVLTSLIRLLPAGNIESGHPQRYYKYALIDPIDQPFATFRYHFRTWEQLDALGIGTPRASLSSNRSSSSNSSPSPSPSPSASTTHLPQNNPSAPDLHSNPALHPTNPPQDHSSTTTTSSQTSLATPAPLPTLHETISQTSLTLPPPPPAEPPTPTPSPLPILPGSFPLPSPSPIPSLQSLNPRRSLSPFDWLRRTSTPTSRTSSPFKRDPSPRTASSMDSDPKKREKSKQSNLSVVAGLKEEKKEEEVGGETSKSRGAPAAQQEGEKKKRPGIGMLKGVVASATRRKGGSMKER
ncbi:MAG: hypothetical protein M1835_007135 [Candelina submexicana]|nr:MAG: hypothetical protein M1835_007135 [Candelina submexicana]